MPTGSSITFPQTEQGTTRHFELGTGLSTCFLAQRWDRRNTHAAFIFTTL